MADGTVYLYFKNKDDILRSIFDQAMALFIAEARKEIELLDDPKEKLRRIAELHLEKLGADRELAIVFQVELRELDKIHGRILKCGFCRVSQHYQRNFYRRTAKGVFRSELNLTVCAKILFGALDEMVTNWILSKKNYALAPMAEIVTSVFFDGVLQR